MSHSAGKMPSVPTDSNWQSEQPGLDAGLLLVFFFFSPLPTLINSFRLLNVRQRLVLTAVGQMLPELPPRNRKMTEKRGRWADLCLPGF